MQEEEIRDELSICPSFNSYYSSSGNKLADIAIKVVSEESSSNSSESNKEPSFNQKRSTDDDDDDDFEFALVRTDHLDEASLPAGGARIGPVFPVFNRDLLLGLGGDDPQEEVRYGESESRGDVASVVRVPLNNLFIGERDIPSSSSSEADELETVQPGTYCVWSPVASPGRCKKSNSTGSSSSSKWSKRWRFRDLLRRSSSDGKDPFVLVTPSTPPTNTANKRQGKSEKTMEERTSSGEVKVAGKPKANEVAGGGKKVVSAHEVFYVKNRAMKDGDKRRSYLPYKQDIVGLFASNVNGLSLTKNFPSF